MIVSRPRGRELVVPARSSATRAGCAKSCCWSRSPAGCTRRRLRRRAADAVIGYDTRERLTEIEIPTLIVWGLNDHMVPVEAALGYHRLIPARGWRSSSAPDTCRSSSGRRGSIPLDQFSPS